MLHSKSSQQSRSSVQRAVVVPQQRSPDSPVIGLQAISLDLRRQPQQFRALVHVPCRTWQWSWVLTCASVRQKEARREEREYGGDELPYLPEPPGGDADPEAAALSAERRDRSVPRRRAMLSNPRSSMVCPSLLCRRPKWLGRSYERWRLVRRHDARTTLRS